MKRFYLSIIISTLYLPSSAIAQFVPPSHFLSMPNANTLEKTPAVVSPPTFPDEKTSVQDQGGSETFANFLTHLTPSVDTRIPESPTQAAHRINHLINTGQHDKALIELATLQRDDTHRLGIDVQLLFLEGRAYAAKGDLSKALSIYHRMTLNYPELAEPWNNMAILQMQAGSLDDALNSLQTALAIKPNYVAAEKNLAIVYMKLAQESFAKVPH